MAAPHVLKDSGGLYPLWGTGQNRPHVCTCTCMVPTQLVPHLHLESASTMMFLDKLPTAVSPEPTQGKHDFLLGLWTMQKRQAAGHTLSDQP